MLEASITSKKKEEKDINELDIMAHRRLRDATSAAAIDCKQQIESCDENIKYLKEKVTDVTTCLMEHFPLTLFIARALTLSKYWPIGF